MCLIAVAWQVHPDYPLVMVSNRDEFLQRPTAKADHWEDHPNVFGGRDLSAGGTWLGLASPRSETGALGRMAAVTNVRNPAAQQDGLRSRGDLVKEFLTGDNTVADHLDSVRQQQREFNGFNLLVCDGDQLGFYSNGSDHLEILSPGIYGISNADLDTPWPKVVNAKNQLQAFLKGPIATQTLASLLHEKSLASDDALPSTGISLDWERALSAQFIEMDNYGTRCTTAITVANNGVAEFVELTVDETPFANSQVRFDQFWTNSNQ